MWAWVLCRGARGASSGVVKVDIDLCDAQGMVCVQMGGFSARSTEGVIPFDDADKEFPAQNAGCEREAWNKVEASAERVLEYRS
jgi:hypothetical protein